MFNNRKLIIALSRFFALPPHVKLGMPSLSPTMNSGKVLKWSKKVGDPINQGDIICEVQTDKATVPFEVQEKGFVAKLITDKSEFNIGDVIAIIAKSKDDIPQFQNFKEVSAATPPPPSKSPESLQSKQKTTPQTHSQDAPKHTNRIIASPLAKNTAAKQGVDLGEVKGTGPSGRIIQSDVLQHKKGKSQSVSHSSQKPSLAVSKQGGNPFVQLPLSSMRKTIAARLTQSKSTVPHFYLTTEIMISKLLKLRQELNSDEKTWGVKVSINDMIMLAVSRAVRDVEGINYQWGNTHIKKFQHVDLSMAVATPNGLITPIIFRAETLGLKQISAKSKQLAKKARDGKLQPNQFIGGTISISNVGMYGVDQVLPIINPPQSMIVGVGSIKKVVISEKGSFVQADKCVLSIAVDHRVIDGALAASWLTHLKRLLQNPNFLLL